MNKIVLDSSALLALFFGEPGSESLTAELMEFAVIGAVNFAEAQAKIVDKGGDRDAAWRILTGLVSEVIPFTADQARICGNLIAETRPIGLSLGDRACLALAETMAAPIYTADRAWRRLNTGLAIHQLR